MPVDATKNNNQLFDFDKIIEQDYLFTNASASSRVGSPAFFLSRNGIGPLEKKDKAVGVIQGRELNLCNFKYITNEDVSKQSQITFMIMPNNMTPGVMFCEIPKNTLPEYLIISSGDLSGCIAGVLEFEDSIVLFHEGGDSSSKESTTSPNKSVQNQTEDNYTSRCKDVENTMRINRGNTYIDGTVGESTRYTEIEGIDRLINYIQSLPHLRSGSIMFSKENSIKREGVSSNSKLTFTCYRDFEANDKIGLGNLLYIKKGNDSVIASRVNQAGTSKFNRAIVSKNQGDCIYVHQNGQKNMMRKRVEISLLQSQISRGFDAIEISSRNKDKIKDDMTV